ncbi:sigma-70 family RNA polymerase sigma factor [Microbacterium kyungheense]|nr:sigma-70 family RNA polymerase sigma factor [Microbacterium kyungheense]
MDHDDVREQQEQVGLGDADLVVRTRAGDRSAFGELWRRHYRAGVTVARNMTSSLDPDDLVQEAYTRIYQSIVAGGGPTGSFRAYLFTSIRNTAAAWGRSRRETAYDELDGVEDPSAGEHASEAALDRGLTHRAFRSLPTRWQEVLWYSEIEQMKPAEIAPLLGMKATAVAQLTFRAREGLREAWIQAHLQAVEDGSDCQRTIERLGAYARRNLGRRDHAKVDAHLVACVRCSIVASEAREVSSRLALVLLPLALGAVGTTGYLATLQGGSAPLVALAAMPSTVVQGAVTVLPAGVTGGAAGGGAAGTGAAGTGAAGGGAAAGSGAAAAGAGAASGAGAATGTAAGIGSGVAAGAGAGAAAVSTVAAGGTALAGIGAASGLAAASLVVVGGVVAAVSLPPADAAPEPAKTSISDVAPVTPPLVLDTGAADNALQLPANGPAPADLPAAPPATTDAVTTPVTTTDGTTTAGSGIAGSAGASSGGQGNGAGGQGNGGGQSKDDTSATAGTGNNGVGNGTTGNNGVGNGTTGNSGVGDPTNGTGGGNGGTTGNSGTTGNGTPTNGTGNGNGGNTGNGGSTGNGTPTNGTGNGNGGNTGNGGSTGNGTPTNGTGNGNGGNTGKGNGTANGNNGKGNGTANGNDGNNGNNG